MMKNVLRIIPFIGLIIVLFSAARILATPEEIRVEQKDGVAYADGVDLSEEMVFISYWYWEYYPEKLYEPADFADGLPEEPVYIQPGPNDTALYGTYRMRLKVPAGGVYAITGDSFLYAQRAYADGTLIGQMGDPRPTAEQTISQTGSYTYYFSPQSDETELIFQVANFCASRRRKQSQLFSGPGAGSRAIYVYPPVLRVFHGRMLGCHLPVLPGCVFIFSKTTVLPMVCPCLYPAGAADFADRTTRLL